MIKEAAKTLKRQVEYCLETFGESRDSDIELTILVWRQFYSDTLYQMLNEDIKALFDLPSEAGIKRIRAHYQNTLKLYPPTKWEVARHRGWNEQEWRKLLGYSFEDKNQGILPF